MVAEGCALAISNILIRRRGRVFQQRQIMLIHFTSSSKNNWYLRLGYLEGGT